MKHQVWRQNLRHFQDQAKCRDWCNCQVCGQVSEMKRTQLCQSCTPDHRRFDNCKIYKTLLPNVNPAPTPFQSQPSMRDTSNPETSSSLNQRTSLSARTSRPFVRSASRGSERATPGTGYDNTEHLAMLEEARRSSRVRFGSSLGDGFLWFMQPSLGDHALCLGKCLMVQEERNEQWKLRLHDC